MVVVAVVCMYVCNRPGDCGGGRPGVGVGGSLALFVSHSSAQPRKQLELMGFGRELLPRFSFWKFEKINSNYSHG